MERLAFLEAFAAERGLTYESRAPSVGLSERYVYSPDMNYRYAFARWWDASAPIILWVGINPGKGDTENRRRPTLDRCVEWSRSWGAGGLAFANLFAARHNKPKGLRLVADPVGPHNDAALEALSAVAWRTVAAWGGYGKLLDRWAAAARLLTGPVCLGVTASGQPRHPLYVRRDAAVIPWPPAPKPPNHALRPTGPKAGRG